MSLLLLEPHCLFIIVSIAQKVWNNCQFSMKPFCVYMLIFGLKRHQDGEHRSISDSPGQTGRTEQTNCLG